MNTHPAADDIVALYQRHATKYDQDRAHGRALMERDWLDRFRAACVPGLPILDLGCGVGEPIAAYLIAQGHKVLGVDSSPPFVDICRTRFPDHRWRVGDMRTLHLDERFGGLLMWCSFFHLTQDAQRAMFPMLAQHAAPTAALMFTSGPAQGEAIGAYHGDPLYHASLAPAEYEALLNANGFRVLSYVPEDATCGGLTVWLAQFKEA